MESEIYLWMDQWLNLGGLPFLFIYKNIGLKPTILYISAHISSDAVAHKDNSVMERWER